MAPSPFHGIFSALTEGLGKGEVGRGANLQSPREPTTGAVAKPATGRIAVDIYDLDDYTIIKAPIAGVRLSDLDIEVNDNVLTIRGWRRQTDSVPTDQYYIQECFWGESNRSITLPFAIDARKVKASFSKDCILKILIPKEEKVKIVRINEG